MPLGKTAVDFMIQDIIRAWIKALVDENENVRLKDLDHGDIVSLSADIAFQWPDDPGPVANPDVTTHT